MKKPSVRPVIILGAARSGTKMIRDSISAHPDAVAIPYDVNFIWKYGNYGTKHDELTPADVSSDVAAFVRKFFESFRRSQPEARVVEKTVSNTVRVDFVRKIFPDCQFVHLVRDGRDVSASSRLQWQAPLDGAKVVDKLKYFPIKALPTYGAHYALSYLARKVSRQKRVSAWGVAIKDLNELLQRYSLLEVCGLQWSRCVEHTIGVLNSIPAADRIEVRYERLVHNPVEELGHILDFLGLGMTDELARRARENIKRSYVSTWKRELQAEDLQRLMPHISGTMRRLGYLDGE